LGAALEAQNAVHLKGSLPTGKIKFVVNFKYDGDGMGKGGAIAMTANGERVTEGRLEKKIHVPFSLDEGLDVGTDVGSAVDFTYHLPFTFTGSIDNVTVDLK
jgi:hypothetical protein